VLRAPFRIVQLFLDSQAFFSEAKAARPQLLGGELAGGSGLELAAEAPVDLMEFVAQTPSFGLPLGQDGLVVAGCGELSGVEHG
jgi:hypothetical protein